MKNKYTNYQKQEELAQEEKRLVEEFYNVEEEELVLDARTLDEIPEEYQEPEAQDFVEGVIPEEVTSTYILGVVINCNALNLREEPGGNVISILSKNERLEIYPGSGSTVAGEDWLKVNTTSQVVPMTGYVMRKFVAFEE